VTDLLGGHVSAMFNTLITALPQVKAGRMRGLAVTGTKPSPLFPGVPTVADSGVPGFEVSGWYAILVPANTPAAIVARLNTELLSILKLPEVRERLAADGSEAVGSTPQQLADRMKLEMVKWAKVVKAAGIQPE
jgi:tripartite-type tricarboxylate transporter receptor subunit TctC